MSGRSRIELIGPGHQTHAGPNIQKREEGSEMHTNDVSIAEMESRSTTFASGDDGLGHRSFLRLRRQFDAH
jgi:hypothetical protein